MFVNSTRAVFSRSLGRSISYVGTGDFVCEALTRPAFAVILTRPAFCSLLFLHSSADAEELALYDRPQAGDFPRPRLQRLGVRRESGWRCYGWRSCRPPYKRRQWRTRVNLQVCLLMGWGCSELSVRALVVVIWITERERAHTRSIASLSKGKEEEELTRG